MVAASSIRRPCLARPILVEALDCYQRADFIGSGVRLREAATRWLVAAVDWYGVKLPKEAERQKYPRPSTLLEALYEAGAVNEWALEAFGLCIAIGNEASHCQPLDAVQLLNAIEVLFCEVDGNPFSTLNDRPVCFADFDDDGGIE